ncbi:MAG: hypothetical protein EBQ92_06705 [Proteobacteria bacterium]|nr:hypothetical protein [Pseudomonadota bacterium]
MESKSHLIITKGLPDLPKKVPAFCREHGLGSRCGILWIWDTQTEGEPFTLVRRLLKLFPFESLSIEVDEGRRRDVFSDWDSYLEWINADAPNPSRLFSRIKVFRRKHVLGFLVWEQGKNSNGMELAIYTQHDQTNPISEACETLGTVEVNSTPAPTKKQKLWIYDWAFSFFNSSVRRGTTSKRSPTIP